LTVTGRRTSVAIGRIATLTALVLAGCSSAVPRDTCSGETCSGHGECVILDGESACLCDEGYRPENLDCVAVGGDGDADSDLDSDMDDDVEPDGDGVPPCPGVELTPGMVLVNEGFFPMGCNPDVEHCVDDADNVPLHEVYLDEYEIDRLEVTVAEYRGCVEAGACGEPGTVDEDESCNWGAERLDDHPVNCVSWYGAEAYCAWVGKRLCTEAEWERAGRGTDSRPYPWGDEYPTCQLAAIGASGSSPVEECAQPLGGTWPVGSAPADCSPCGARDMLGNVSEWVWDWYDPEYYRASPARNPQGPDRGGGRVMRGADFTLVENFIAVYIRLSGRRGGGGSPGEWNRADGFRCCRPVDSEDP
jgi:sulfatase modifying factor 1